MRKSWPLLAGIAVLGALAGAAIAGQSSSVETFVIDPAVATTADPSPAGASTVPPATVVATTTAPVATTTSATTTSVRPSTTTSTTPPSITTTSLDSQTLPREQVRLVLANGDGRYNLVTVNAERLRAAGYVQIVGGNADHVPATILYYRPSFDDEALIVAADLLVPNALLAPYPDVPVTGDDDLGDIIVVLGPDSFRELPA